MTPEHSTTTTTDSVLLEQLRGGSAKGLSQLYTRYYERVLRFCVSLLKDRQLAEDVAQNVFLKLHLAQQTIRNGDSLQSWLFTVARNLAYNELERKRPAELCDEEIVWDGEAPDDALVVRERKELVDAALVRLHVPYREVLVLRVYEQLSYDEIAAITGTTVASVKSRLFKARKALVEKLQPYI